MLTSPKALNGNWPHVSEKSVTIKRGRKLERLPKSNWAYKLFFSLSSRVKKKVDDIFELLTAFFSKTYFYNVWYTHASFP